MSEILFYTPFGLLLAVFLLEVVSRRQRNRESDLGVIFLLVATSITALSNLFLSKDDPGIWPLLLGILSALAAVVKHQWPTNQAATKPRSRGRRRAGSTSPGSVWALSYYTLLLLTFGALAAPLLNHQTAGLSFTKDPEDRSLLEDHINDKELAPTRRSNASSMSMLGDRNDATAMSDADASGEGMAEAIEPETSEETTVADSGSATEGKDTDNEASEEMALTASRSRLPVIIPDGTPFHTYIVPIIRQNCLSCHGPDQQKGGLRLDSPEWIRKGGSSGAVVFPGRPDRSSFYTSVILPEGDPDIMPAKGDRLSTRDTDLIMKWIRAGAQMGDSTLHNDTSLAESRVLGVVDDATAQALESAHILARALEDEKLELNCSQVRNYGVPINWTLISDLGSRVVSLDLARTDITDDDLKVMSSLPQLTHLDLSQTGISDAGIAHLKNLAQLEVLNLYGTRVGDEGLAALDQLKNLKKIYLWKSKATSSGVEHLTQAIPGLIANLGT